MAHFYGSVKGQAKSRVTRIGGKKSGIQTIAASCQGSVQVDLFEKNGKDYATVRLVAWHGHGTNEILYNGPVEGPTKK